MPALFPQRSGHIGHIVAASACLISAYGSIHPAASAHAAPSLYTTNYGVARVAPAAPFVISGLAFRDANFNGARELIEVGVAGVIVTAYDVNGSVAGATTTVANGTYSLTPVGAGPYRIEFSGWASYLRPGPRGTDSGTSVQFVATANTTSINLGLANPADFGSVSPRLATTVYAAGDANSTLGALVSWPYTADTDTKAGLVTHTTASEIGANFGLAYKPSTQDYFTAAFVKRGVGLGVGGPGAIYKVPAIGPVSILLDLGAAAGGFTRTRDFTPNPPSFDEDAMALVGKAGFGDLDISEDETTLWTINLANRSLYKIDIAAAEAGPADVGATLVGPPPNPGCVNDSSGGRPFGLKVKDGILYVGGVCTGQDGPALGSTDDIEAYVYTYTESAGWGPAPVLRFPLDYPTTCADVYPAYSPNKSCNRPGVTGSVGSWYSWFDGLPKRTAVFTTEYTFNSETTDGFVVSPQPQLTGIEFSGNDMIVAFRDRFADQLGWDDPGPFGASLFGATNMSAVPMGDILRASPNGAPVNSPSQVMSWTIEKNTTGSTFGPTVGAGTGAGPCVDTLITPTVAECGEFFVDNFNPTPDTGHDETTMGSVAQYPGYPEVAVTAYDPFVFESAGVLQLSNVTGARVRGYEVVAGGSLIQAGGAVNKTNGLGDLEALLDPAPLEIGNLVWRDSNSNGVQDPDEAGIAGVTVNLYRPGVGPDCVAGNADDGSVIATALTSATGQYYFKTGSGPDALPADETGLVDGSVCVLQPTATYSIRLDNPADYAAAGPLNQLFLTERDDAIVTPSGADSNDSDSSYVGTVAVITHTVPANGIGASNHTLDFGFALQAPIAPGGIGLGNQVWFDANNNRVVDLNEAGVPNVALQLFFDADGNQAIEPIEQTPVATQTTTAQGFYLFTQTVTGTVLAAGNYAVCVAAGNFAAGGALNGYFSSGTSLVSVGVLTETIPATPDGDADNDDNGLSITNGLCTNGVLSGLMSVTGNEPLNEVPTNAGATLPGTTPGLIDSAANISSNLTLDFGFVLAVTTPVTPTGISLGNQVWFDTDNDGAVDANERGVGTAILQLFFDANGNNMLDPIEQTPVATQTTTAQGFYLFTNTVTGLALPPGNYAVCVTADNFAAGGALRGYFSSGTLISQTGALAEPDPEAANGDADNNDNGRRQGAATCMRDLLSVTGNEPAIEVPGNLTSTVPGTTPGLIDVISNTASNLTLDFGFYQAGLGNMVWIDENNSGRADGQERGLNDVPVKLFPETGPNEIPVGPDGCWGTADDAPGGTRTSDLNGQGMGRYAFCGLPEGTYRVCIVQPVGYGSSTGGTANPFEPAPDPDGEGGILPNADGDDNGTGAPNSICTEGIESKPVTLRPGHVPNVANAVDDATGRTMNPTVDFGLIVLGPNAVSLTSFEAAREGDGIRIRWHTGAELNTFGFAVYRSEGDDRAQATLVTNELVAALGADNTYQVVDAAADPTRAYHYWLKEYEQMGESGSGGIRENWYGPAVFAPNASAPAGVVVAPAANPLGGGVQMALPLAATPASARVPVAMSLQSVAAAQTTQQVERKTIEDGLAVAQDAVAQDAVAQEANARVAVATAAPVDVRPAMAAALAAVVDEEPANSPDQAKVETPMEDMPPPEREAAMIQAPAIPQVNSANSKAETLSSTPTAQLGWAGWVLFIGLGLLMSMMLVMGLVMVRRRRG